MSIYHHQHHQQHHYYSCYWAVSVLCARMKNGCTPCTYAHPVFLITTLQHSPHISCESLWLSLSPLRQLFPPSLLPPSSSSSPLLLQISNTLRVHSHIHVFICCFHACCVVNMLSLPFLIRFASLVKDSDLSSFFRTFFSLWTQMKHTFPANTTHSIST